MQRFRGGLVFKAHRLCVSLNSRLESNNAEEKVHGDRAAGSVADLFLLKSGRFVSKVDSLYGGRLFFPLAPHYLLDSFLGLGVSFFFITLQLKAE